MDALQKERGNVFDLLQKEGATQKGGGFPQKRASSNPGGNYAILFGSNSLKVSVLSDINSEDSGVNNKILVEWT